MPSINTPLNKGQCFLYKAGSQPRSIPEALTRHLYERLRARCPRQELWTRLAECGLTVEVFKAGEAALTYVQMAKLYQQTALALEDEMVGLWFRPMRIGALRNLLRVMIEAPSLGESLERFAQFMNLMLDDYQLDMVETQKMIRLELKPRTPFCDINPLGHVLILKLAHGILTWLSGDDLAAFHVGFAFVRPDKVADLDTFFSAPLGFNERYSTISFRLQDGDRQGTRRFADITSFIELAPESWIKTIPVRSSVSACVYEILSLDIGRPFNQVSCDLNVSARTLNRKLRADNLSFREIRNKLRQERAKRDLVDSNITLDEIAYALGFNSTAAFHRAFRQWTGTSPGAYRTAHKPRH